MVSPENLPLEWNVHINLGMGNSGMSLIVNSQPFQTPIAMSTGEMWQGPDSLKMDDVLNMTVDVQT